MSAAGITAQQAIDRVNRILDRMGIPYAPSIVDRMKTVRLYRDALRGKWLREKKKAVAANRALEAFRSGQTKSWKLKAEDAERRIAQAVEVFQKQHKAITHPNRPFIVDIVTYLVDRSNQLFANDSAVEKRANEEVKAAKELKARAESRYIDINRRLAWYEQRFGTADENMTQDITAAYGPGKAAPSFVALGKDADSFPWRRGNPGYLGDYKTEELIAEVERRSNDILTRADIARGIAMGGVPICGNRKGEYVCTLHPGHAGTHAQKVANGGLEWETW